MHKSIRDSTKLMYLSYMCYSEKNLHVGFSILALFLAEQKKYYTDMLCSNLGYFVTHHVEKGKMLTP